MPTPVRLDFVPPSQPDLVSLHVEQSASETGPFSEVEVVTEIGAYPNYISYVTVNATAPSYWFRIFWRNVENADTPYSDPIQGGTTTLVQTIVDRVMVRNPVANEIVVTQTAEWVICFVMGVEDPYDPNLTATYAQLEGMTLLTLVRSTLATLVSSSTGESYSAGLVSQKSSTAQTVNQDLLKYLLNEANKMLGLGVTFVFLLEDIDPTGIGASTAIEWDASRTQIVVYE